MVHPNTYVPCNYHFTNSQRHKGKLALALLGHDTRISYTARLYTVYTHVCLGELKNRLELCISGNSNVKDAKRGGLQARAIDLVSFIFAICIGWGRLTIL